MSNNGNGRTYENGFVGNLIGKDYDPEFINNLSKDKLKDVLEEIDNRVTDRKSRDKLNRYKELITTKLDIPDYFKEFDFFDNIEEENTKEYYDTGKQRLILFDVENIG